MAAYYNEIDPYAAQWLRNLIEAGHIAPGIVDERDIREVKPDELRQYTQCHFFAGIGVWSLALRQAGWPDDKPVWTGSCPCQPFSSAGGKAGFADERHLWPHWFHLITQCRPETVFGEQVASKDGLGWLDLVQTDLEGAGYANAAVDLCAAGVGAPHIRQRLWFVAERLADSDNRRQPGPGELGRPVHPEEDSPRQVDRVIHDGGSGGLGNPSDTQREKVSSVFEGSGTAPARVNRISGMANTERHGQPTASPTNGFWRDADWLFCRDGKWRPVRPGSFPLVDGAPARVGRLRAKGKKWYNNRVGRLRAYGNAINAEVATLFIKAYRDEIL